MNSITKPLISCPIDDETLKRVVRKLLETKLPDFNKIEGSGLRIETPENYLLLEGRKHGNYEYQDTYVCMHRLALDTEVEQALRQLSIYDSSQQRAGTNEKTRQPNPLNPSKENSGINYLGYAQQKEAMDLVHNIGGIVLTSRQGLDLKFDLEQTIDGNKKLYDANKQLIQVPRLKLLHDEIFAVRAPWRSEWLNARFEQKGGEWFIHYFIRDSSGKIIEETKNIGEHLRKDCKVDLASINDYGIPKKQGNDLNYWYPRDKSVAGLSAGSVGAYMGWGDPSDSGAALGVRFASTSADVRSVAKKLSKK